MAKNKFTVDFDGLNVYRKKLEVLGGDAVKKAFDDALLDTQKLVAEKVSTAMSAHNDTGKVKNTIIDNRPAEWAGDVASIDIGFDITAGGTYDGLPSIFLMYGTTLYGQPHIKPDKNLYDAVYGNATKKEVQEIQKNAFIRAIDGVMNE